MNSHETMRKYAEKKTEAAAQGHNMKCYERIGLLLDEGSFVELNSLVRPRGLSALFNRPPVDGDGVVTGYGEIEGQMVYIAVQDPDIYGGSMGQMHSLKIREAADQAVLSGVPLLILFDTGGARIEEGILALEGLSELLSVLSDAADLIPVVSVILGPCPGGSAVAAGLSHFRFFSNERGMAFMNGPMVTAASEGTTMDPADIGGGKIHSNKTGFASFVYDSDEKCLLAVRNLISYFPDNINLFDSEVPSDDPNRTESELDDIASAISDGYSIDRVVELVFDSGSFLEVSAGYQSGVITALARIDGLPVAVIANRSQRMEPNDAGKLTEFVKTCDLLELPLISFVDCEGFSIGLKYEYSDILKKAVDLYKSIDSYSSVKIAVITGKAIGTAFLTLSGKNAGFDHVYAWPTAQISVVNADTAANILYKNEIAAADDVIMSRKDFTDKYSEEIAAPQVAASYGYVDEIIYPSSTRPRIASALQII